MKFSVICGILKASAETTITIAADSHLVARSPITGGLRTSVGA